MDYGFRYTGITWSYDNLMATAAENGNIYFILFRTRYQDRDSKDTYCKIRKKKIQCLKRLRLIVL